MCGLVFVLFGGIVAMCCIVSMSTVTSSSVTNSWFASVSALFSLSDT